MMSEHHETETVDILPFLQGIYSAMADIAGVLVLTVAAIPVKPNNSARVGLAAAGAMAVKLRLEALNQAAIEAATKRPPAPKPVPAENPAQDRAVAASDGLPATLPRPLHPQSPRRVPPGPFSGDSYASAGRG